MEGPDVKTAVVTIDNGKYGKREIRFETGRLARQAAGTALVYLDDDSMLLSATNAFVLATQPNAFLGCSEYATYKGIFAAES